MSANPTSPLNGKLLFPFIAPPNGGKGTQTAILSKRYNLPTFDMGATFRGILKEGTDPELATELQSYMSQGKLVPVQTVLKVFTRGFEALAKKHPDSEGFILDGFPRNADQATGFAELCKQWGAQIGKVIYLKVGMDVVAKRATGRRFCSNDATHVYNINEPRFMPQNKKLNADGSVAKDDKGNEIWLCDEPDQAELIIRADDEPETVQKRLVEYQKETDPLIEHFRRAGQLAEIDGARPANEVTQDIEAQIQPLLKKQPTTA